jgi:hypothetical protein
MKRLFLGLVIVLVMCFSAIALPGDTSPASEGGNVIVFTGSAQATTTSFSITAIAWLSNVADGRDIDADDDMSLTDTAGVEIIGARAEAVADDMIISFPTPIIANGLRTATLDGGYLYIYGERR